MNQARALQLLELMDGGGQNTALSRLQLPRWQLALQNLMTYAEGLLQEEPGSYAPGSYTAPKKTSAF
jgi:hypothetical protein